MEEYSPEEINVKKYLDDLEEKGNEFRDAENYLVRTAFSAVLIYYSLVRKYNIENIPVFPYEKTKVILPDVLCIDDFPDKKLYDELISHMKTVKTFFVYIITLTNVYECSNHALIMSYMKDKNLVEIFDSNTITSGYETEESFFLLFKKLRQRFPGIKIKVFNELLETADIIYNTYGFNSLSNYLNIYIIGGGRCLYWTMFMMNLKYKFPEMTLTELLTVIFKKLDVKINKNSQKITFGGEFFNTGECGNDLADYIIKDSDINPDNYTNQSDEKYEEDLKILFRMLYGFAYEIHEDLKKIAIEKIPHGVMDKEKYFEKFSIVKYGELSDYVIPELMYNTKDKYKKYKVQNFEYCEEKSHCESVYDDDYEDDYR